MSAWQAIVKRVFDLCLAFIGLLLTGWLIVIAWLLAGFETRQGGFFLQTRVGRHGRPFNVIKIRTMRNVPDVDTTVTVKSDPRITPLGRFFRRTKIDELPQLWNVLVGQMSFVGPRPDVAGFADTLEGADKIVLSVRPGITGPATLKYRHEEELLLGAEDPEALNRDVIYPDKVRINRQYVENYSFFNDISIIWKTIAGE